MHWEIKQEESSSLKLIKKIKKNNLISIILLNFSHIKDNLIHSEVCKYREISLISLGLNLKENTIKWQQPMQKVLNYGKYLKKYRKKL